MRKCFNTEGHCIPKWHYMVNLDERLQIIKEKYVDTGKYFVINRGRQYGKTTTLRLLAEYLKADYGVFSLDFQKLDSEEFSDSATFSRAFAGLLCTAFRKSGLEQMEELIEPIERIASQPEKTSMTKLFAQISVLCERAPRPLVLLIDEVDSASNNQVFIDFLALLRAGYLDREDSPAFYSVILAGVYDIKNLKLKIRPEAEHQYNSPWNIAARFNTEFAFSAGQIGQMLREYEADHGKGIDIEAISQCIYDYTSGYPYLVSAICKLLDEEIPDREGFGDSASAWTKEGIRAAVKILLNERTLLFDSMAKQLDIYPELRDLIAQILYQGREISFNLGIKSINLGHMFGFLREKNGYTIVANRIFEMYLLGMFISEESIRSEMYGRGENDRSQFIHNGRLDMDRVLEKFVESFHEIYGENDDKFVEKYGRKFFLLYLKPIINGSGNYYMEAQTRDMLRTDVIVDYRGEQFVVEMKIWRGNEYNQRGERQLAEYLDYYHLEKGYMLSFNFNQRKEIGVKEVRVGERILVEAVV